MSYNIFTTLASADIVDLTGTEVTTGLWSLDTGSLGIIYTSSYQVENSGEFYYDLYNLDPSGSSSEVQFSVAYGHVSGGGSPQLVAKNDSTLPTRVIYSQYRNILLDKDVERFSFGGTESNDIYVINFQRSRLKQALDPGNWELGLKGTVRTSTFIDDSGLTTAVSGNLAVDNVYNIKSGSLATGTIASDTIYGLVFPDYGVIVLYPSAISASIGLSGSSAATAQQGAKDKTTAPFAPYTGIDTSLTSYQYQHEGLVRAISGSMAAGTNFLARSAEAISSKNIFIRLRNTEYNYSNNPSYYTGSAPQNILPAFRTIPRTYITTIGLYNSNNELLAVAKLSKPVQKSPDKEVLVRVRLDF